MWVGEQTTPRISHRLLGSFYKIKSASHPGTIGRVSAFTLDIAEKAQVQDAVKKVHKWFGCRDSLAKNAGSSYFALAEQSDTAEARNVCEVNVFGFLCMPHAVLPELRNRQTDAVGNSTVIGGLRSFSCLGRYRALRIASKGLFEARWQKIEPIGVRLMQVKSVQPPHRALLGSGKFATATTKVADLGKQSMPRECVARSADQPPWKSSKNAGAMPAGKPAGALQRAKRLICGLLCSLTLYGAAAVAIETPTYTVTLQEGAFEVRDYAALIVAQTTVRGDRDEASNAGFRILASYIFGANTRKQGIAMTAPVVQARATGESIAMTAPVVQAGDVNGWIIRFVMPRGSTLETLPVPNDARVKLLAVPPQRYAVVQFSGLARPAEVEQRTTELAAFVTAHRLQAIGAASLARYNPPWTPWFMRRNEVMLPLQADAAVP